MNPHLAYQQQSTLGQTRIDMLLSLFNAAIERLDQALDALRRDDRAAARPHLVKSQLLVSGLASGVNLEQGELALNLLRLYEFVVYCINTGDAGKIEEGGKALRTLREGFEGIRDEAIRLEQQGTIPPIGAIHAVQATV